MYENVTKLQVWGNVKKLNYLKSQDQCNTFDFLAPVNVRTLKNGNCFDVQNFYTLKVLYHSTTVQVNE